MLSSNSFMILVLTSRSVIHFYINFCILSEERVQLYSFVHGYPVVPAQIFEMIIVFILN